MTKPACPVCRGDFTHGRPCPACGLEPAEDDDDDGAGLAEEDDDERVSDPDDGDDDDDDDEEDLENTGL